MRYIVILSMLSLLSFTGCRVVGNGYIHMPPAHAPAHGRRSHHLYHYYPNAEFYFDVRRNKYFYLNSGGRWVVSVRLPRHLHSHLRSGYVEINMEGDRPYLKHKHHKNKYKKNRKYKRNSKAKQNHNKNKSRKMNGNTKKNKSRKMKGNRKKNEKHQEEDDKHDRHNRGR